MNTEVPEPTTPENGNVIVLAGPTCSGKSSIAMELASRVDGVIVNSDRYYLYACENMTLGLGLGLHELEMGDRKLFGILSPHDVLPTPAEYLELARVEIDKARTQGRPVIVEGSTYAHCLGLLQMFGPERVFCVGHLPQTVLDKVERRIQSLVREGLFEEVEQALRLGYGATFPMTRGVIYRSAVPFVLGRLSREEAVKQMVAGFMEIIRIHDEVYGALHKADRIVSSADQREVALAAMESLLC